MKMTSANWKKRENKQGQRELIFDGTSIRNASVAVMFPGTQLICVKEAFKRRIISPKTFLVVIEKIKSIRIVQRLKLEKLGFEVINAREFDGTPRPGLAVLYGDTKTVNLSNLEIEFGFFDFCGNIHSDVMEFINRCNFKIGADLAYTFAQNWRQPELPTKIRKSKWFLDASAEIVKEIGRKPFITSTRSDYGKMDLNTILLYGSTCRYRKEFVWSMGYRDSRCFMQTIVLKIKSNRIDKFWAGVFTEVTGKSPDVPTIQQLESRPKFSSGVKLALIVLNKVSDQVKSSDVTQFIQEMRGCSTSQRKKLYETVFKVPFVREIPEITSSDRIALRNLKKENFARFGERILRLADAA